MLALFPTPYSFLSLAVRKKQKWVRDFHMRTGRALKAIYIYIYIYIHLCCDVAICINMSLFLQLADNASSITCGHWDPQANGLSRQVTCSVQNIVHPGINLQIF